MSSQIYLYAQKGPHRAGFTLATEDLATELAHWLLWKGWTVVEDYAPPRMTPDEHAAASALAREFAASR
jgi:hypothetical protein